jgi:hypothetical protein
MRKDEWQKAGNVSKEIIKDIENKIKESKVIIK